MEAVVAGVDLADFQLLGGGIFVLDDAVELALVIAQDAAVAGGVIDDGGGERRDGVGAAMGFEQFLERFGSDERAVAGEDEDIGIGKEHIVEYVLSLLDSVACSELLFLHDEGDAAFAIEDAADVLLAVADDKHDWHCTEGSDGLDDPAHHGLAGHFVGDLGKVAIHARAFACSEDNRCKRRRCVIRLGLDLCHVSSFNGSSSRAKKAGPPRLELGISGPKPGVLPITPRASAMPLLT